MSARRGAPRLDANSWPHVTGTSHNSFTHARTCISCAGLRTPNVAEIAKAETRFLWFRIAARVAASSSVWVGNPPASCPPGKQTIASLPRRSTSPLLLTCSASYPSNKTQTGEPLPSTTELVVKVVDKETKVTRVNKSWGNLSKEAAMPSDRSKRVVRLLAEARTLRFASSKTTSVNVPPVSMPKEYAIGKQR